MNIVKLVFFLFLVGCQLPASEVSQEAKQFKKNNSEAFKKIKYQNRNIHYVVYGNKNAQPLMLVHGSPGSWDGWIRFINDTHLNTNYRIIVVDRPGFGESDYGASETSIHHQAEALHAVLKEENLTGAILVGHSFGGAVIARMAMNHSTDISGLIFVASSVSPDLEKIKWFQYPASWIGIKSLIPTDLRVCNEEIFTLKQELEQMLPLWSSIKSDTIIIHGLKDNLVPHANKDFLVAKISAKYIKDVVMIEDLDHFIPWRKPELIKQAIFKLSAAKIVK
jgi:pimeloyl-ACP methyl ester carboxylesterase